MSEKAAQVASRTFWQRIGAIAPYFRSSRRGIVLAFVGSVIGALTEPMIPSFMQHLLDAGFQQRSMPLWQIPVIVIGLFGLRGFAGFIAQYGLAWAANRGMVELRECPVRAADECRTGACSPAMRRAA
jgi:subfamily B ATP-binding cassette protein MsbA